MRRLLIKVSLIALSVLIGYIIAECGYRVYHYTRLRAENSNGYPFYYVETPLYSFDSEIGYRYNPNLNQSFMQFDADNNLQRSNNVRTNNLGHISPNDDSIEKPDSEFRVAVLGDSLTASLQNDIPWPSILEQMLNADDALKSSLGVSKFKVINFGMDGTGVVQFSKVYDAEARRFNPDAVIINFITDDIKRKFIWRAVTKLNPEVSTLLICTSLPTDISNRNCVLAPQISFDRRLLDNKNEVARIKRDIYNERVKTLPWFSLYPELLARVIGSKIGLHTKLNLETRLTPYFDSDEEAIRESLGSLQKIRAEHPKVLILHIPLHEELPSDNLPQFADELAKRDNRLEIVPMAKFLPKAGGDEIKRWFNLPFDGHFSNKGAEIYARAVYERFREYLSGAKAK